MYLSQNTKIICNSTLLLSTLIILVGHCICLKIQNVFVSNYKMYLSQIILVAPVAGGGVEQQPPVIQTNSISRSLTPIRSMTLHYI